MIIWGSDYPFGKISLREVSPMSFGAMRTVLSAAALVFIFSRQGESWAVSKWQFLRLVVLALLGAFLNRVFWSIGVSQTTASNAALLMATSPIFVFVATFLLFRTEVTFRAALGVFICFLGVFLVIRSDWHGWSMSSETIKGDLICIAASASWALFTLLSKRLLKDISSLKLTTYVMLIGAIIFLPFLPNEKAGGWFKISAWAWFGVLYVGLMGNCLAYFLYVYGVKSIGALRTVLYQYLTPVAAILFALLFLKESITGPQLLGAGVVFFGIFLSRSG
jgi:drug/metabolite transporter (DMT)-like permease